mmetsp:Transcript_36832/g.96391  ORF Transcript_36832/g.96391 Transcript_36832/m.96391 type:complete len:122 (+) Transcript_36832:126-491(+)
MHGAPQIQGFGNSLRIGVATLHASSAAIDPVAESPAIDLAAAFSEDPFGFKCGVLDDFPSGWWEYCTDGREPEYKAKGAVESGFTNVLGSRSEFRGTRVSASLVGFAAGRWQAPEYPGVAS